MPPTDPTIPVPDATLAETEAEKLLREWYLLWLSDAVADAKLPDALHVRTALYFSAKAAGLPSDRPPSLQDVPEEPGHACSYEPLVGAELGKIVCECGWVRGCPREHFDEHRAWHWIAMRATREALAEVGGDSGG